MWDSAAVERPLLSNVSVRPPAACAPPILGAMLRCLVLAARAGSLLGCGRTRVLSLAAYVVPSLKQLEW